MHILRDIRRALKTAVGITGRHGCESRWVVRIRGSVRATVYYEMGCHMGSTDPPYGRRDVVTRNYFFHAVDVGRPQLLMSVGGILEIRRRNARFGGAMRSILRRMGVYSVGVFGVLGLRNARAVGEYR